MKKDEEQLVRSHSFSRKATKLVASHSLAMNERKERENHELLSLSSFDSHILDELSVVAVRWRHQRHRLSLAQRSLCSHSLLARSLVRWFVCCLVAIGHCFLFSFTFAFILSLVSLVGCLSVSTSLTQLNCAIAPSV